MQRWVYTWLAIYLPSPGQDSLSIPLIQRSVGGNSSLSFGAIEQRTGESCTGFPVRGRHSIGDSHNNNG